MNLADWIYLATGLGVGVVSRWFLPPKFSASLNVVRSQQPSDLVPTQLAYLMAHQMSQFKGGFLARTSHELRSPLSNIIGLHQLILSDLCDDRAEERQFVAQAHEAALQLVKLIDEVLTVARLEHGSNNLEIQPLQLSLVLEEVCSVIRMIAANRRHQLRLSPCDPEIYVLADPRWLRQIILNLVDAVILRAEDGEIFDLSVQVEPKSLFIHIWLDVPLASNTWSEPVDLLQGDRTWLKSIYENINSGAIAPCTLTKTSPGFVFLLTQILLEVMQGKLELLPTPTDNNKLPTTRMQISIPLSIPDTALLGLEP